MQYGVLELRITEVTNSSCSVLATSHWNQKNFETRFISIYKLRHRICNFSRTTQLLSHFLFSHRCFFVMVFTEVSSSLILIFSVWHQQKYLNQNSAFKFYPKKAPKSAENHCKIGGERGEKKVKIRKQSSKKQIFSIE